MKEIPPQPRRKNAPKLNPAAIALMTSLAAAGSGEARPSAPFEEPTSPNITKPLSHPKRLPGFAHALERQQARIEIEEEEQELGELAEKLKALTPQYHAIRHSWDALIQAGTEKFETVVGQFEDQKPNAPSLEIRAAQEIVNTQQLNKEQVKKFYTLYILLQELRAAGETTTENSLRHRVSVLQSVVDLVRKLGYGRLECPEGAACTYTLDNESELEFLIMYAKAIDYLRLHLFRDQV